MKKANSQGDQVKYRDFSLAVENVINDVKVDPYYLVQHLLDVFFNGRQKVLYDDLITFFGEFSSYFENNDIEDFMKEVQFIKRQNEEVDIAELASMIRVDVEQFYK